MSEILCVLSARFRERPREVSGLYSCILSGSIARENVLHVRV
jgi:hypothetical protein